MADRSAVSISAVVRQALSVRGPMTEEDLLGVLDADGIDIGPDAEATLAEVLEEDTELVLPLADGRWAWLPALLDGRTFTHRLSETEVAHDMLTVRPDLAPVAMLTEIETFQRCIDGTPVVDVLPSFDAEVLAARGVPSTIDDEERLLLPPGYFAQLGMVAGDLVGLRVSANGFELTNAEEPAPSNIGTALAALLDEHPDRPESLESAVWTACAYDDSLFRQPAAPLGDRLDASGLAREGDWVARGGFDFTAWRVAGRIESIRVRHELDEDEALAVLATVRLYEHTRDLVEAVRDAHVGDGERDLAEIVAQATSPPDPPQPDGDDGPDPERATVRAVLEFLAEPVVAAAALAEMRSDDEDSVVALGAFAESAEPLAPRVARPALRWFRANAYEAIGDFEQAEVMFQAAESLDSEWPLTLLSLARYAADRGDAERSLALLRRAGAPADDELVELLERFRPAARPDLGRNERCWCGSGRKYKVCHLNREQLPLERRAAWLYEKALAHLLDGRFAALLVETAEARAQHWGAPGGFFVAIRDTVVRDAVLFEGGAFVDFLDKRGFLLPEDERSLAEQWLLVPRSVYEVGDVSRGQGFTVRDVRTGDVHRVQERAGSTQVKSGELYCARVVPAGDTMQIFGGIEPVSLGERDEMIALLDGEPDPVDLVSALSRRFAPPVLQNTEGEPLMMCHGALRVDDPARLARALDDAYEREDDETDGSRVWFEYVVTHGMQRIRAQIELSGEELHVRANSAARFERVLATVRTLDPSVTVLSETREPAGDMRAVERLAERDPSGGVVDAATDPAIAAALDELVRKHEAAWLDEPIPALAGHTPRECALDPTRRPDLIRLLDSFPQDTNQPGTMSPRRLRAALGLN